MTCLDFTTASLAVCAPLVQALAANPLSRLRTLRLSCTNLPVWPLLNGSGQTSLHLHAANLQQVDLAFLSSMLQTSKAQSAVTAFHVTAEPQEPSDAWRNIVHQLAG